MVSVKQIFAKIGWRRIVLLVLGTAVLVALTAGLLYYRSYQNYQRDVNAIKIQGVDLTTIEDGEYYGVCDVGFVRARVKVVVKDHKMTDIELIEHINERGAPAEVLPERMIEEQRVDVDAVSGATSSSNVIREAVYNALTGKHSADEGAAGTGTPAGSGAAETAVGTGTSAGSGAGAEAGAGTSEASSAGTGS